VPPLGSVGLWAAALAGLSVAAVCLLRLTRYVSRWHVNAQHVRPAAP
jgi:hypothetical protein